MVEVQLDGRNFEKKETVRHFVEPDSYEAKVFTFSEIYKQLKYKSETETEERMVVTFQLLNNEVVHLPYFIAAKVIKCEKSSGYSNSKLYDFIDMAGNMTSFRDFWGKNKTDQELNKKFQTWLVTTFIGRKVKIFTKTVQPAEGVKYSVVERVVRFLDENPQKQGNEDTLNPPQEAVQ